MTHKALLPAILAMAACSTPPGPGGTGRWVDLTHAFSERTLYWPTSEQFRLEKVFEGTTPQGFHYAANRFSAAEHGGTHLDAPIHFAAGGATVDRMVPDQLIGPAVVIDLSARTLADRDYRIGIADLVGWEAVHGPIPAQSIVLLRTGYEHFWPDPVRYLGTAERGAGAVAKLHFPGLAPEAAEWLAAERHIKAVGLDTASIDHGQSTLFESHRILARRGIPIFENVAGLGELPATGAIVYALPMKIQGGSGAPLRVVAWVPSH
ncbi:cyclase family protein [Candidatus Methylocalor cossyra]|uniref:Cyclase n=1 Tax=Candidatus Methylocalor cossyra TaxID=3108543 RepID=A0ABP1C9M7_9GAMM